MANRSIEAASSEGLLEQMRDATFLLYQGRSQQKKYEDAILHLEYYYLLKDSIQNLNINNKIVLLEADYEAKVRENQLELERRVLERRRGLQYYYSITIIVLLVGIGLGSKKLSLNKRYTEASILFSFLLLFEFLLILSDSKVDSITKGSPLSKLIINSSIAILIIPVHRLSEKGIRRLVSPDYKMKMWQWAILILLAILIILCGIFIL